MDSSAAITAYVREHYPEQRRALIMDEETAEISNGSLNVVRIFAVIDPFTWSIGCFRIWIGSSCRALHRDFDPVDQSQSVLDAAWTEAQTTFNALPETINVWDLCDNGFSWF
jgi:hypothetical protein